LKFKITERFSFTTDTAHPPGAASLSPITWYKDYLAGEKYFDHRSVSSGQPKTARLDLDLNETSSRYISGQPPPEPLRSPFLATTQ
jgi:hypothetical protein